MLVVTVEIWPFGKEENKRHLGTAKIWNMGTGTMTRGDYKATLSKVNRPGCVWRGGQVKDFPRKRLGAWDLLYRVLHNIVGKRNMGAIQ